MPENVFHLALTYEHIGLQLAVELHDEMNINISTDKQILSIIFNSGTTWSTYIHTSMAL